MIEQLLVIEAEDTVPFKNLALEEYLLHLVGQNQCILYLWQNRSTVVIGKNQNAWKECQVEKLEQDGGFLVRRISGGGAVFHDLGNLNFTFLTRKENYNVDLQTKVIVAAVKKLGVAAEKNGRNDITVEGRKISGNAYYQTGDRCFHHGTILLHVDKERMSSYLQVSREKLQSKSVDSVRSRVANLGEFSPSVSVGQMKELLIQSFGQCYGLVPEEMDRSQLDWGEIDKMEERYRSWDWKYGRRIPFDYELAKRFSWGDVQIQIQVDEGRVKEAAIYSDTLDTELIHRVSETLRGTVYHSDTIKRAVMEVKTEDGLQENMKRDMMELICGSQ